MKAMVGHLNIVVKQSRGYARTKFVLTQLEQLGFRRWSVPFRDDVILDRGPDGACGCKTEAALKVQPARVLAATMTAMARFLWSKKWASF